MPALLPYPAIDPVLVRFGPLMVRWYGLAYVAAFMAAFFVLRDLSARWRLGLTFDDMLEVMIAAIVGVVLGARLGYVFFYGLGYFVKAPLAVFAIWDGGMSFHGGLLGILVAGWVVSRRLKVPFLTLCDIGAVAAPIGFFLGRLANFVNDELWGRVSDVPWAMVFPNGGPMPRHPSQLYEAALEGAVLFCVMWALSRRVLPRGTLVGWLLVLYGCFRIFVEFFRQPEILIGPVTIGQALSAPMVIAGVALLVWARRHPLPESSAEEEGDSGARS